jgi:hypothetical protein
MKKKIITGFAVSLLMITGLINANAQRDTNVSLCAGLSLFKSSTYVTSGNFQFINVGAKATKELKFNDKYSLPVYVVLGVNPHAETAFLVAGITF